MFFYHLLALLFILLPLPNTLQKIGYAISPKIGAPIDARSLKGVALPFCPLLLGALLYLPPICQTPF